MIPWEIISHFQTWHWLYNNYNIHLSQIHTLEDQSHSFSYLTFQRTSFSLCYKKALHISERKLIYILALIHHLPKIHLRHLIFDWDRLMGILAVHLVFSGSITALSKLIRKKSAWLYIIIPILVERHSLKFDLMLYSLPFQKVSLRTAYLNSISIFL